MSIGIGPENKIQKTTEFLETATPREITEYWKKAQGNISGKELNKRWTELFHDTDPYFSWNRCSRVGIKFFSCGGMSIIGGN